MMPKLDSSSSQRTEDEGEALGLLSKLFFTQKINLPRKQLQKFSKQNTKPFLFWDEFKISL